MHVRGAVVLSLAVALAAAVATPARAVDRALLVGVGQYQTPGHDLPGIDLDLRMMRDVATLLGYRSDAVKVLADGDARLSDVEAALRSWLVEDVGPGDRVLLYVSAHGSRIPDRDGDEADGADEVIVLHDTVLTRVGGRPTLRNALTDDRLGEILSAVPARDVLVIIDSCHSGTATRSFPLAAGSLGVTGGFAKSFSYAGMPRSSRSAGDGYLGAKALATGVALGAARDDESAIATRQGSLFTLAIHRTLSAAEGARRAVTPQLLVERAAAFIESKVAPARVHHPQITGSASARSRPFRFRGAPGAATIRRERLRALVDGAPAAFAVSSNRSQIRLGEDMVLTIDVPSAGYLNVVSVGPDDEVTVLFPNAYVSDSQVDKGPLTLPSPDMPFALRAAPPAGSSLVAVFLSAEPVNLYKSGFGTRDATFRSLSPAGERSVEVVARERRGLLAAGKVVVTVR